MRQYGRPNAKRHELPYKEAPPPANPVLRGLPLYYLAKFVSNVPLVQDLLWNNSGFGALRNTPGLADVEPRYDPTVVISGPENVQNHRKLLDEDWESKKPSGTAFKSALDFHEAYKSGKVTPSSVAKALLPLIRRDVANPSKHSTAFLESRADLVLQAAIESTARYHDGKPLSVLDGVPVCVKDEVALKGYRKCLGSKHDYIDANDSTSFCVQQWLDAGAIIIGKTNMHELGLATTNNNPNFGTPLNPYNDRYYCGGSSGGGAYAAGAGSTPIALGADGGGSIRIPAAYCGGFGLKTSHGRVSGRPTPSLALSTGVLGPIAANMVDLEISYRIMAEPDPLHDTSSLMSAPGSIDMNGDGKKVLGIPKRWFDQADAAVQKTCYNAIDFLTSEVGYTTIDIDLPMLHEGQMAHAMTILAEISSGVSSTKDLTAQNQILVSVGSRTPAIDFLQAQKVRNLLMQHLSHLYSSHPGLVIVTPTTPNAGWSIAHPGDLTYGCSDENNSIRSMTYVWLANFSGCPAISAPVGYADAVAGEGRVPVGLMGMGEWCAETALLRFGYDVEAFLTARSDAGRARPAGWVDVLQLAGETLDL
ncbi:hypothetical protein MBLNU230_g5492t1 [Neophaeotheca triangularis]